MKKLLLSVVLVALQGGALFAQDLTGAWQGLMLVSQTPGDTLHVVFRISTTVGGTLKADMYSIDQGGHAIAPEVTLKGSDVKIPMPSIGATYVGKMSADGNSITGKWTGAGNALTLNLTRAGAETAWKIPEAPPPPRPMPPDADPKFEVVSIKLSKADQPGRGMRFQGRQFSASNLSADDLITFAYGIHPRQLAGAPDWVEKTRYEVLGKPDVDGQPNERQTRALVQKLLADRFGLTFHREKKELSVYAIVVGKSGAKLTKSDADPKGDPNMFFFGQGNFNAKNATIADFAGVMQRSLLADRPVVDHTGLIERYDFGLAFRFPENPGRGAADNPPPPGDRDALPDIFTAIQQQLGLRAESTKAQVDMFVIDLLEKPSEN